MLTKEEIKKKLEQDPEWTPDAEASSLEWEMYDEIMDEMYEEDMEDEDEENEDADEDEEENW